MAMSQQPTNPGGGPAPAPGQPSANSLVAAALQQALSQQGVGGPQADRALVPLWKVRLSGVDIGSTLGTAPTPKSQYGREDIGHDRRRAPSAGTLPGPRIVTTDAAEAYWLDATDEERKTFAATAQSAGFWKPSQGMDALVAAWGKAVSLAAQYNANKTDQKDWLSPFEAVEKLAVKAMADGDQSHDGFSTQTTIKQYSQGELLGQARQILQNELGRNPTDSEMKAYTAAVNAAAAANPSIVTGQTTQNPDGSSEQNQVVGAQYDPGATITGMVEGTAEHDQYQGATKYYQALLGALNSVV